MEEKGQEEEKRYIVRLANQGDVSGIAELIERNNYTHFFLPRDTAMLQVRVAQSMDLHLPGWFFVMEQETEDGEKTIVGTSQIEVVHERFMYRIDEGSTFRLCLEKEPDDVLGLGSLLLDESLRSKGLGLAKLLSYSRLLFLYLNEKITVRRLLTEFVMHSFWEKFVKPLLGDMTWEEAEQQWDDDEYVSLLWEGLPARIALPQEMLLEILMGEDAYTPQISKGSMAARRLLAPFGFQCLGQIELEGGIWYGCDWGGIRGKFDFCKIAATDARILAPDKEMIACGGGPEGFLAHYALPKEVNAYQMCFLL
ncbi:MAG: hypothetical protein AAB604_01580 [Patescibacteria group bacterium]